MKGLIPETSKYSPNVNHINIPNDYRRPSDVPNKSLTLNTIIHATSHDKQTMAKEIAETFEKTAINIHNRQDYTL
jgi:hypothetical protein